MKYLFRFLCVMTMLSYSLNVLGETATMWVGDSWRVSAPAATSSTNSYGYVVSFSNYDFQWNYDPSVFSISLSDDDNDASTSINNVAMITLKNYFQGTKTIKCIYSHLYYKSNGVAAEKQETISYIVSCKQVNVSLYPTVMSMEIGESQTLQWQFTPSNSQYGATIGFSSSDINVAMVDFSGNVTAIAPGTATITAATNFNTTATCEVTVNPMLATSISLNQTTMSLAIGASQKLTATILPSNTSNKTVIWSSSDENVAIVDDNGNVTGVATGTVAITATTNDGTSLSSSCTITVTQVSAGSIHLGQTEAEMYAGQTLKLTATVLPAGASQRVTWSSSDPSVAKVVGGTVYAQDMGECLITARTLDGTNLAADCLIMVYPEQQPSEGNGDVDGDGVISIADVTALIDILLNK